MITANHYGLLVDGGMCFLHEQSRSRCLSLGYERLESPFEIETNSRLQCPHRILPLDFAEALPEQLSPGSLSYLMSPIPNGGAFWVPLDARKAIKNQLAMTPSSRATVFFPWVTPLRSVAPELSITNAAPLVIMDYEVRDLQTLAKLVALPRVRTIILCGEYRIGDVTRIDNWDETERTPAEWAEIGRGALLRHVQEMSR